MSDPSPGCREHVSYRNLILFTQILPINMAAQMLVLITGHLWHMVPCSIIFHTLMPDTNFCHMLEICMWACDFDMKYFPAPNYAPPT